MRIACLSARANPSGASRIFRAIADPIARRADNTISTAIALAISPAAAPPMPSATMNSEPFGPRPMATHRGLERRVVRRQIDDDERVLVVLARAADVGAPKDVDDDLRRRGYVPNRHTDSTRNS